jgi:predicted transcriptional regulator of viral defense system
MDINCYTFSEVKQSLSRTGPSDVLSVLARLGGTARTGDILAAGVHPRTLYAARDEGALVEVSRGVWRAADLPLTEPDLLAVATRMPRAVVCLVSALHLHGLTQEIPRAVHVALPRGVHPARLDYPPLEVYHLSAASFAAGVEQREVDGVTVRVTSPARSVADAFKFRSRLGLEAALDALKQTLHARAATPAQIDEMARVCRVQAVLRPYLQALA